jgi:AAA family ATP:ADP antiporter
VVQVARRVSNFALARPTREVLFTSVLREDRYKAKKLHRHRRLPQWRPGWQLVLHGIDRFAGADHDRRGHRVAVPISAAWLALAF